MKTRFLAVFGPIVAPWMLITDLHFLDFAHIGPRSWIVMSRIPLDLLLLYFRVMKTRFLAVVGSVVAPWMLATDLHYLDFAYFGPQSWIVISRIIVDLLLLYFVGRSLKEGRIVWEPSPAQSIAGMVVLTGLVAAAIIFKISNGANFTAPTIIAALTIVGSVIAYRVATKHAPQIGEARFPTPPDDT